MNKLLKNKTYQHAHNDLSDFTKITLGRHNLSFVLYFGILHSVLDVSQRHTHVNLNYKKDPKD